MRKPQRLYSLTRPKLRQSWNKFNLYNLYRLVGREPQIRGTPTFFQQKWAAKSKTRAYHGEHIPEKKWVRLFSRRLLSAVDMPPRYLATYDGSEQATGRGSGLTTSSITAESYSEMPGPSSQEKSKRKTPPSGDVNKLISDHFTSMTPYMQMTFAPLERRLDTAIFRALFASSVRQARQFVLHGAVRVNGKKMLHPSYQLNPGDMFQVDVEKVMYATGQQKKAKGDRGLLQSLEARKKRADAIFEKASKGTTASDGSGEETAGEAAEPEAASDVDSEVEGASSSPEAKSADETDSAKLGGVMSLDADSLTPEEQWKMNDKTLKSLIKDVKKLLESSARELSAKEKKQLRLFRADAKRYLSHPQRRTMTPHSLVEQLQAQLKKHEILGSSLGKPTAKRNADEGKATADGEGDRILQTRQHIDKGFKELSGEQKEKAVRIMGASQLSREEMRKLARLLKQDEENPVDESKPYATPWQPRTFMPAFAFIPRYLEVNPKICAAVYIRHPMARKGMAEVPTPFSYLTNQLAHNWYLGRG